MKKITLIAAIAAISASSVTLAESFEEAYLKNRAMYGAGHVFEWNGKQYSTDREEEVMAAKPATKENAMALLDAAKAKHAESQQAGFAWRDTGARLKEAEDALTAGDFQKSMDVSARAHYQARMALVQRDYAETHWIDAVPPLN